ncbi:MAG: methyl-accepting chemotaxis protein, partial [Gammaproteobacteria bacterium]|nr:methyl-accepting chemotaxis protein [Gammaproteobacteria bacterium]
GYFELGEELDHLVKGFQDITNADISMWVGNEYAEDKNITKVFEKHGDWHFVMGSDNEMQYKLMSQINDQISGETLNITADIGDKNLNVGVFPYQDAFGNNAGVVAISADTSESDSYFSAYMFKLLGLCLVLVIIAIGITIFLAKNIARPLNHANAMLKDISSGQGDLTKRLKVETKDEVGQLASNFNVFIEKLHSMIKDIKSVSEDLSGSVNSISNGASATRHGAEQQASEAERVATAVNEMASTVQEVARNAAAAADSALNADEKARSGKTVVTTTVDSIRNLVQSVEQSSQVIENLKENSVSIGTVLDVIKGIAEQTNLLALNAAIEAARAGEQGRGFAVVADEVRTLAKRTQESTQEIEEIITSLQEGANNAVTAMASSHDTAQSTMEQASEAGQVLDDITIAVGSISDMNRQIATATEEQTSVAQELDQNIVNIRNYANDLSAEANKSANEGNNLDQAGAQLQKLIGQFKI